MRYKIQLWLKRRDSNCHGGIFRHCNHDIKVMPESPAQIYKKTTTMTYDFSVPMYCKGKECGSIRERAGTKQVYIQQFVQNFLLEMDTFQFDIRDHNSNAFGSRIGLTEENP